MKTASIYRTACLIFSLFLMLCVFSNEVRAQDRFHEMKEQLELLKQDVPGLEAEVEISVDEIELEEFLRGIALSNELNISVDPTLQIKVTNNFVNVNVADILIFLARKYDLELEFIGSIINITKYVPPVVEEVVEELPEMKVEYDNRRGLLTLDLRDNMLEEVIREITAKTHKNVLAESGIEDQQVSAYILEMPFESAVGKMAMANGLEMDITEDGYFYLHKVEAIAKNDQPNRRGGRNQKNQPDTDLEYAMAGFDNITVKGDDQPLDAVVNIISKELGVNYFVNTELSGTVTLQLEGVDYEEFLEHVFNATKYTYRKVNGVYVIGDRGIETLRSTHIVELQHRSVENVIDQIPKDLAEGVTVKEFGDLNSLILSGSTPNIMEVERFLKFIDKVVPVVYIEVMIVDYNSSREVKTGVHAGIGENPAPQSSGELLPGVDYKMNSSTVNSIIESLNGRGLVNLGKVTPNFYLNVSALEQQGVLKVRSTPKLTTLNGNEAKLSIGNTEYYTIASNNVIGSQNPQNIITTRYESVSADLTVRIKPFVSGDEQITMEVEVQQSDFTERISPDAPPGSVTRSFSSLIRVRNEEMILLGGLEEKSTSKSGRGVPLLSRIPVIKWLFSERTKLKASSKLNIFIKPTVFY